MSPGYRSGSGKMDYFSYYAFNEEHGKMNDMQNRFTQRVVVTLLGLAMTIASINAASLYVQMRTKSDLARRVEDLESSVRTQRRKNEAVDKFLGEVMETVQAKLK